MRAPPGNGKFFRFATFEVDVKEGTLRKGGIRLRIQPQPLKILFTLLERPGELVTREELRHQLWPADTFVDFERGLNGAVTRLRQTLGDSADTPRFIQTEARLGYRLIVPVEREPGDAAPHAVPAVRRSRGSIAAAAAALLSGLLIYSFRPAAPGGQPLVLDQLTRDLGLTTDPAVSPDGKLIAYASDRNGNGNLNIWVQQLSSGGERVQVTRLESDAHQPAFSPDGSRIAFRVAGADGGIYTVPAIGGEPQRIAGSGRNPRYSPDGKWIAFWTMPDATSYDPKVVASSVFVIPASGGTPRKMGIPDAGCPVWSADSSRLLVAKAQPVAEIDWWLVPLSGGRPTRTGVLNRLQQHQAANIAALSLSNTPCPAAWTGDSVVFSSRGGDSENIWSIRVNQRTGLVEGSARQITSGTAKDLAAAVTPSGKVLFASLTAPIAIWSLHREGGNLERLSQSTSGEVTPAVMPDGKRLTYASWTVKSSDIHWRDLDTGADHKLVASPYPYRQVHPQLSRDGARIAYSDFGPSGGLYVVSTRDGKAERVSEFKNFIWTWSPGDTQLILNRPPEMWSLDLATRKATPFLRLPGATLFQAKYSPDDRWLTLLAMFPDRSVLYGVPLRDGRPAESSAWVPMVEEGVWVDKPRWSPDGAALYYISDRDGFRCIWSQPLDPVSKRPKGRAVAVRHFHQARLSPANVPNGLQELEVARERMFVNLGELTGNIWSTRLEVD